MLPASTSVGMRPRKRLRRRVMRAVTRLRGYAVTQWAGGTAQPRNRATPLSIANINHLTNNALRDPRKILHPLDHILECVRLAAVFEAFGAAGELGEVAALEHALHLVEAGAVEDLAQGMRLQIAEDLIAVGVVAAVRHAAVGEDHDPREKCALHAAIELAVQIGLLVDVERLARLLDHASVAILLQLEKAAQFLDR